MLIRNATSDLPCTSSHHSAAGIDSFALHVFQHVLAATVVQLGRTASPWIGVADDHDPGPRLISQTRSDVIEDALADVVYPHARRWLECALTELAGMPRMSAASSFAYLPGTSESQTKPFHVTSLRNAPDLGSGTQRRV